MSAVHIILIYSSSHNTDMKVVCLFASLKSDGFLSSKVFIARNFAEITVHFNNISEMNNSVALFVVLEDI